MRKVMLPLAWKDGNITLWSRPLPLPAFAERPVRNMLSSAFCLNLFDMAESDTMISSHAELAMTTGGEKVWRSIFQQHFL